MHSVIRMNAFDYLVKGDWRIMIVCVRVVLEASIIAKQHRIDGRLRTKCNVFEIRKERVTYWHVENEF